MVWNTCNTKKEEVYCDRSEYRTCLTKIKLPLSSLHDARWHTDIISCPVQYLSKLQSRLIRPWFVCCSSKILCQK
jgi:hypothetical protein